MIFFNHKWNSSQGYKDGSTSANQSMWYINKRTDKNHRVILIRTEKSLENIQHSFMIKIVMKVKEGIYQNIIKVIYDTPTANIILNSEMLREFPLKSGTRQWCLVLLFLFKIVLIVMTIAMRQAKEIKVIQIRREEIRLPLFSHDMQ